MSQTVAFRMRIDPRNGGEYRRRHADIWPELKAALLGAGVLDYRIFLDPGTGDLFAIMTRTNENTLAALAGAPVMQRWWAMMADFMPQGEGGAPWSADLEPVFALLP